MQKIRQGMVLTNLQHSTKNTDMVFLLTQTTKSKLHTYLAGLFEILLRYGNIYIFVFYGKDRNTILENLLKNCANTTMSVEHNTTTKTLKKGGVGLAIIPITG